MPVIANPDQIIPARPRRFSPGEIIMLLLYPVIFLTGGIVGLVIGLKQSGATVANTANDQANVRVNSTIVPTTNTPLIINSAPVETSNDNVNLNANADETNINSAANTNAGANGNTNATIGDGEYLQVDKTALTTLQAEQESSKVSLVDDSLAPTDIIRQKDLVDLLYHLKAYALLHNSYPTTGGKLYRLNRSDKDPLYTAMKKFYGPGYNEHIDPESPTYYYGYLSNGKTFSLTAYLVSKKQVFTLYDTPR